MSRCRCGPNVLLTQLDPDELVLLGQLIEALRRAVANPVLGGRLPEVVVAEPGSDDEQLAWLAAQFAAPGGDGPGAGDLPDPALRRLFPDPCPTDPEVSADLRRLTLTEQRQAKIRASQTVLDDMTSVDAAGVIPVQPDRAVDWMMTLTAVRLLLAARMGIEKDEDEEAMERLAEDDPDYWAYTVYMWLGWLQESMLDCLIDLD
ncbi:MAG: DUF2017 domain-containing protein [Actinomycetia bacterium]|nr:DUF2017 domain-containing protein [Actinomycetes bacterium]